MPSSIQAIGSLPEFTRHIHKLETLSCDTAHSECMTNSQIKAIGFDGVKDAYIESLNLSDIPCSLDAICLFQNGLITFIEFKNGHISDSETYAIRKKIYDSLLIFQDLTSLTLKDLRTHAELILVYRDDLNPQECLEGEPLQAAPSRDKITEHVFGLAKSEWVRFGLKRFRFYCFKNVHTYTPEAFEEYLKDKISIL